MGGLPFSERKGEGMDGAKGSGWEGLEGGEGRKLA